MSDVNREEIVRLTEEYGGQAGLSHTRRLLRLVSIIGEGLAYDADVVWLAAHLHDWGGYPKWAQAGVDHALRSKEVAEAFLAERSCPPEQMERILECIETHHSGDPNRRVEAILLSDADALDFLGAVGVLRDCSRFPRDLRKAYESARAHRQRLPGVICLERSRAIAQQRIERMDALLAAFEDETFGCF